MASFKIVSTTADSLWAASAEQNVILLGQGIIVVFGFVFVMPAVSALTDQCKQLNEIEV